MPRKHLGIQSSRPSNNNTEYNDGQHRTQPKRPRVVLDNCAAINHGGGGFRFEGPVDVTLDDVTARGNGGPGIEVARDASEAPPKEKRRKYFGGWTP